MGNKKYEKDILFLKNEGKFKEIRFIGNLNDLKDVRLYDTDKGSIVLKKNKENNEELAYNIFNKNFLIECPRLFHSSNEYLVLDFVKRTKENNLEKTIIDWANVHSKTLESDDFGLIKEKANIRKKMMSFGLNKLILSLTHGDLYNKNIIGKKSGQVYIDFENFGFCHPSVDLSLLIFNSPELKEKIIETYISNINFDYIDLRKDINIIYKKKLIQIINFLEKIDKKSNVLLRAKNELKRTK